MLDVIRAVLAFSLVGLFYLYIGRRKSRGCRPCGCQLIVNRSAI